MIEPTKAGQRVKLTEDAGEWFSDLRGRTGTVVMMDGYPVCDFGKGLERCRIHPKNLEVVDANQG